MISAIRPLHLAPPGREMANSPGGSLVGGAAASDTTSGGSSGDAINAAHLGSRQLSSFPTARRSSRNTSNPYRAHPPTRLGTEALGNASYERKRKQPTEEASHGISEAPKAGDSAPLTPRPKKRKRMSTSDYLSVFKPSSKWQAAAVIARSEQPTIPTMTKTKKVKESPFQKLQRLPDGCHPDFDNDHLCCVNNLREFWHKSHGAVFVDDKGIAIIESIGWEAVIVDYCQSSVIKHLEQFKQLPTDFRMVLLSSPLKDNIVEYKSLLAFLHSPQDIRDYTDADALAILRTRFKRHIAYERKACSSKFLEYWVPAYLSHAQLKQYSSLLLANSSILQSQTATDNVKALQDIVMSLWKCCNHPCLVGLQHSPINTHDVNESANDIMQNSGKLLLLDKMLKEIKNKRLRVIVLFQHKRNEASTEETNEARRKLRKIGRIAGSSSASSPVINNDLFREIGTQSSVGLDLLPETGVENLSTPKSYHAELERELSKLTNVLKLPEPSTGEARNIEHAKKSNIANPSMLPGSATSLVMGINAGNDVAVAADLDHSELPVLASPQNHMTLEYPPAEAEPSDTSLVMAAQDLQTGTQASCLTLDAQHQGMCPDNSSKMNLGLDTAAEVIMKGTTSNHLGDSSAVVKDKNADAVADPMNSENHSYIAPHVPAVLPDASEVETQTGQSNMPAQHITGLPAQQNTAITGYPEAEAEAEAEPSSNLDTESAQSLQPDIQQSSSILDTDSSQTWCQPETAPVLSQGGSTDHHLVDARMGFDVDNNSMKSELQAECNQEIEKVKKKFELIIQKEDQAYHRLKKDIDDACNKVFLQQLLAEDYREKFMKSFPAQVTVCFLIVFTERSVRPTIPQAPQSFQQAQSRMSVAQTTSLLVASPLATRPPGLNPLYSTGPFLQPSQVPWASASEAVQPQPVLPGSLYGAMLSPVSPMDLRYGSYGPVPAPHLQQPRMPAASAVARADQHQLAAMSPGITSSRQSVPGMLEGFASVSALAGVPLTSMASSSVQQAMPSASNSLPALPASSPLSGSAPELMAHFLQSPSTISVAIAAQQASGLIPGFHHVPGGSPYGTAGIAQAGGHLGVANQAAHEPAREALLLLQRQWAHALAPSRTVQHSVASASNPHPGLVASSANRHLMGAQQGWIPNPALGNMASPSNSAAGVWHRGAAPEVANQPDAPGPSSSNARGAGMTGLQASGGSGMMPQGGAGEGEVVCISDDEEQ
nr:unnamed protein product [Digitaria exilis]